MDLDDDDRRARGTDPGARLFGEARAAAHEVAEATLSALLDVVGDGVATIDAGGALVAVSRPLAAMFRCTTHALVGTPWQSLLEPPAPARPEASPWQALIGRRADGSTFPLECSFVTLDRGARRDVLWVMRDVTDRRLLERRLLDVSEQLQRRIGQDLHDGLGQLLTGTAFLAKGLESSVPAPYQGQVQRVVELINQAITRVRSLARGLSPVCFGDESLEAVLRDVVAESTRLFGLECRFEPPEAAVGARPATIAQLCLIAREAITNAVRHGRAGRIVVSLLRPGPRALLAIEDDGVGISPPHQLVEGLGLRSMRARASDIGGSLEVVRGPVGTVVRCWWAD